MRPLEAQLCEIFAEVLGVPGVGGRDDFFELGGHSLLAAKLVGLVRDRLATAVTLRQFYGASSAAALAESLAAAPASR